MCLLYIIFTASMIKTASYSQKGYDAVLSKDFLFECY